MQKRTPTPRSSAILGLSTLFFTEMWERFSLLRHARAPHSLHDGAGRDGRAGFGLASRPARSTACTRRRSTCCRCPAAGSPTGSSASAARCSGAVSSSCSATCRLPFPHAGVLLPGLVLIVIGTGLLKPNISAIVGQLYARGRERATPASRSSTWASTWAPYRPAGLVPGPETGCRAGSPADSPARAGTWVSAPTRSACCSA